MPQCGIAKCDHCDYVAELVEGWDGVEGLYRLPNSGSVPLLAQWIWCNRCSCICQAERLPKVEDIRRELRATVLNVSAWGRGVWCCTRIVTPSNTQSRWRHRRVLKAMLAWRRGRKSPPRCLGCGGSDYQPVVDDFENTSTGTVCHPACGGAIQLELGSIWTGICEGYNAYDPEGNRDGVYRYVDGELLHFASDSVFHRLTATRMT